MGWKKTEKFDRFQLAEPNRTVNRNPKQNLPIGSLLLTQSVPKTENFAFLGSYRKPRPRSQYLFQLKFFFSFHQESVDQFLLVYFLVLFCDCVRRAHYHNLPSERTYIIF